MCLPIQSYFGFVFNAFCQCFLFLSHKQQALNSRSLLLPRVSPRGVSPQGATQGSSRQDMGAVPGPVSLGRLPPHWVLRIQGQGGGKHSLTPVSLPPTLSERASLPTPPAVPHPWLACHAGWDSGAQGIPSIFQSQTLSEHPSLPGCLPPGLAYPTPLGHRTYRATLLLLQPPLLAPSWAPPQRPRGLLFHSHTAPCQ